MTGYVTAGTRVQIKGRAKDLWAGEKDDTFICSEAVLLVDSGQAAKKCMLLVDNFGGKRNVKVYAKKRLLTIIGAA